MDTHELKIESTLSGADWQGQVAAHTHQLGLPSTRWQIVGRVVAALVIGFGVAVVTARADSPMFARACVHTSLRDAIAVFRLFKPVLC